MEYNMYYARMSLEQALSHNRYNDTKAGLTQCYLLTRENYHRPHALCTTKDRINLFLNHVRSYALFNHFSFKKFKENLSWIDACQIEQGNQNYHIDIPKWKAIMDQVRRDNLDEDNPDVLMHSLNNLLEQQKSSTLSMQSIASNSEAAFTRFFEKMETIDER